MKEKKENVKMSAMECCPEMEQKTICDGLRFRYRLPFFTTVEVEKIKQRVPVDVILYFELVRCSGPLVIGDPIYSITLLPGERVRLFTSDRHTQWSYDSESKLSYRHQTTSEESFYAAGMAESMSNLTINEAASGSSSYEESWAEGGGGASFSFLGLIEIGGGGGGGSYDSESAYRFSHSLSQHAEAASRYVAASVRAKSSTSIGEVNQRQHAEGESEEHYESASRAFSNPNKCRAITYLFHKINKVQNVRFKLVAIERRVQDPKVPTGAYQRIPVDTTGRLNIKPEFISAASKERLEKEKMARTSASERQQSAASAMGIQQAGLSATVYKSVQAVYERNAPTYAIKTREDAIAEVDKELIRAKILDEKTHEPSDTFVKELSWEREEILPTPGIIVKGCLDECVTCEPSLMKEIELDLERKELENEMLKRKIELLEKSQEYRCCPGVPAPNDGPDE